MMLRLIRRRLPGGHHLDLVMDDDQNQAATFLVDDWG
jgi:hypothetical protein